MHLYTFSLKSKDKCSQTQQEDELLFYFRIQRFPAGVCEYFTSD